MSRLKEWRRDKSIPRTRAEREEAEKSGETTKCMQYLDFFMNCLSARVQMKQLYEYGAFKSCNEEWEEVKWCVRTLFGDNRSKERLHERLRKINREMDTLPWTYKSSYLKYMFEEDRLPARMAIQLVMDQHAKEMENREGDEKQ